jgi:hypothetical protein
MVNLIVSFRGVMQSLNGLKSFRDNHNLLHKLVNKKYYSEIELQTIYASY